MTWSAADLDTLRALYATATPLELKRSLPGRTWHQIRRRANKLGLHRPPVFPLGPSKITR